MLERPNLLGEVKWRKKGLTWSWICIYEFFLKPLICFCSVFENCYKLIVIFSVGPGIPHVEWIHDRSQSVWGGTSGSWVQISSLPIEDEPVTPYWLNKLDLLTQSIDKTVIHLFFARCYPYKPCIVYLWWMNWKLSGPSLNGVWLSRPKL